MTLFEVLGTKSSAVSKKNFFIKGSTIYIPDFFIIIFFVTLFSFSAIVDIFIVCFLLFHSKMIAMTVFAFTASLHGICEFLIDMNEKNLHLGKPGKFPNSALSFIANKILEIPIYLLGFGSILMSIRILIETFQIDRMLVKPLPVFPHPFFHLSDKNLSDIKLYCCINLVLKSIPQLLITPVFILDKLANDAAVMFVTNILLNTLIFCQTMAMTFPLRRTSRVFTSCLCSLFSALNKFMATMCACYLNLAVFAMAFKQISYYAIVSHLLKSLIWVWPCWQLLENQPIPLPKFHFLIYMTFISLIFSFIYIHSFEGLGKLYYFLFNLLSFFYELLHIYLFSDANIGSITYYFTLKILMFGFLSCYGLLNILHKYRMEEYEMNRSKNSKEVAKIKDEQYTSKENEINKNENSDEMVNIKDEPHT